MSVAFQTEGHKYTSIDIFDETKWVSASKLPQFFKKTFDAKDKSEKASRNKKSKWYGLSPEEIRGHWEAENKRSTTLGTWYHEQQEDQLISVDCVDRYGKCLPVFNPIWEGDRKIALEQKLVEGVYPEHLAYVKSAGVCGQFDEIIVCDGFVHVDDHKGLSLDTPIPTKDGFKLMGDILVGDIIFDGNGKLTEVEHTSSTHYNPCFKFIFDTGESVVCDHEHKWIITKIIRKGEYIEEEFTTEQLFDKRNKGETIRIKNNPGLDLGDVSLPIDPYVLGQWLGDGSRCDASITQSYPEIWEEIERRGYKLGDNVDSNKGSKSQRRNPYGLYTQLRESKLLKNKHIPLIYMRSSYKQRLDLLRGFMDADGYFHRKRRRCVMNTTQEWQAEAIKSLVCSLGGKVTIIKGKTSGFGKIDIDCFYATFSLGVSPFLCRNKDYMDINGGFIVNREHRYIETIEKIDTVPTKCLSVKSDLKSYLFGEGYIKTHNSNKDLKKPAYTNWEGITEKFLAPLMHLENCKLNEYALQLSIGMYMVLRHNPHLKPGNCVLNHVTFEIEGENQFGYPIMKLDDKGEPILKGVEKIQLPYLKREVEIMFNWLKEKKNV